METLVLLLGGNMGNVKRAIQKAILTLQNSLGEIEKQSFLYQTQAWGFKKPANPFLNQVVVFKTAKTPLEILCITQAVEKKLGKSYINAKGDYQNRPIDIDILFYGQKTVEKAELTIPHPGIPFRNFTLTPLVEIMPNFLHPTNKITIAQMHNACEDKSFVKKLPK